MKRRGIISRKKRGQVWVETVIYTLIGLTIIGLLLAVSKPQIDRQKDKALIEQAINGMGVIDSKIFDVLSGTGNKRRIELKLGSGVFTIDAENDKLLWEIDSTYQYSELGVPVSAGKIAVTTSPGSPYKVVLEIPYSMDITFCQGQDGGDCVPTKQIGQASTPHILTVENKGVLGGKTVINFELI